VKDKKPTEKRTGVVVKKTVVAGTKKIKVTAGVTSAAMPIIVKPVKKDNGGSSK
jgi:hypothetical protein